jgi:hypothetical protein
MIRQFRCLPGAIQSAKLGRSCIPKIVCIPFSHRQEFDGTLRPKWGSQCFASSSRLDSSWSAMIG